MTETGASDGTKARRMCLFLCAVMFTHGHAVVTGRHEVTRKDRETALPEDNDTGTECAAITGMDRPTGTRTTRPNFRIT